MALTNSEAEGIEGVPVDSIQLVHQGHAELHQDTNVHVLPLQVLQDMDYTPTLCSLEGGQTSHGDKVPVPTRSLQAVLQKSEAL